MTRIVKGDFRIGVTVPGVKAALFFAHPEALVGYGPALVTSSRYSNHHHWSAGDISIDINRNNLVTVRSNRDACYKSIHLEISSILFSRRSIISGVKLLSSSLTELSLQPLVSATTSSIGITFAPRGKFHVVRGEAKFQIYTLTACPSGHSNHDIPKGRASRDVTAPLFRNGEDGSRILLQSDSV